jgi:antitoxin YefM
MANAGIQIVSDENGQPTAVIVPIELWREIASERETAYLLKSDNMKGRLLAALERNEGLPFEAVIEKLGV